MRRSRLLVPAALTAGAALALSACDSGGGEANNSAMNAAESGFGNAADPSAVETMGNGAEAVDFGNDGNAAGNDTTNAGSDAGGDAAGNTSNRM